MVAGVSTDCKLVDTELDRQFAGQASEPSLEAQRHFDECERCRTLYSCLAEDFPNGDVSIALEREIVQTIRGSLKPVSRLRSSPAIAAGLVIVFFLICVTVVGLMKPAGFELMNVTQLAGISAILSCGVMLLAFSLARQMRPGSVRRIPEWALVGILTGGFLAGIILLFPWSAPDAFAARGWRCLGAGLMMAVPASLVFGFLVRRGGPFGLRSLGGTLGAMAGLLGVTVLQYTCDLQDIGHLLIWHGGVLVLSTLAGAIIGECFSRAGTS